MEIEVIAVGNAHLDPVWLWTWHEGLQAARATFRSALDRIKEHGEFVFTCAGSGIYQWIEKTDPALFEQIRQAVASGRWHLVGGWWLQPDCNIPGGEAFVRHSLYGQRYLLEKFGQLATVGYNVDSFGHAWTLPQILRKSGMDSYVFMRPGPHENSEIPGRLFRWEGPDGSSVLAYQIPYQYNLEGERLDQRFDDIVDEANEKQPVMMLFYGVGNHGGGPTKQSITYLDEKKADGQVRVQFGSPIQYFRRVRELALDPPVYRNELQHHASGCYAAHSEIKRNNRKAEISLATAEKWACLASQQTGFRYPTAELSRAWQGVLFNQFHDILAGTSIKTAYEQARNLHGLALQTADEIGEFARQALAAHISTDTQPGVPLIVWNPTAWPRQEVVHIELQWKGQEIAILDLDGKLVPSQSLDPEAAIQRGSRIGVLFTANVPAFGYRVYWAVKPEELPHRPPQVPDPTLQITDTVLENRYLRVEFDRQSGALVSLFDKVTGRELLKAPARALVLDDDSDTWSHGVFSFRREVGRFGKARFRVMESGPLRVRLRVTTTYESSVLQQDFVLSANARYLDCQATINWRGRHQIVKLAWPVNVTSPVATYEIPYGHIERPTNGEEEPAQKWVDVSGQSNNTREQPSPKGEYLGLTLVNDSKYSFDVLGSELRMTVLRSPAYAHHVPRELTPDDPVEYIDQGEHRFSYRLIPHQDRWFSEDFSAPRAGVEFSEPVVVREDYRHPGKLLPTQGFACVSNPAVILTVVKQAEDGNGVVIRCYESSGRDIKDPVKITLFGQTFTARFGANEIKTFRIAGDDIQETDLLERDLG